MTDHSLEATPTLAPPSGLRSPGMLASSWTAERGLPRAAGHRAGVENVRTVVRASVDAGIHRLTLFASSTENWSRPPGEVRGLLGLIDIYLERELNELDRGGVRPRELGSLDRLPPRRVERAVLWTARTDRLHLNIAFNYRGRAEIVQAARRLLGANPAPEEITGALSWHVSIAPASPISAW